MYSLVAYSLSNSLVSGSLLEIVESSSSFIVEVLLVWPCVLLMLWKRVSKSSSASMSVASVVRANSWWVSDVAISGSDSSSHACSIRSALLSKLFERVSISEIVVTSSDSMLSCTLSLLLVVGKSILLCFLCIFRSLARFLLHISGSSCVPVK